MLKNIKNQTTKAYIKFQTFKNDIKGQGMVEYGLILAVIAIIAFGAFSALGDTINEQINEINTKIDTN